MAKGKAQKKQRKCKVKVQLEHSHFQWHSIPASAFIQPTSIVFHLALNTDPGDKDQQQCECQLRWFSIGHWMLTTDTSPCITACKKSFSAEHLRSKVAHGGDQKRALFHAIEKKKEITSSPRVKTSDDCQMVCASRTQATSAMSILKQESRRSQ